MLPNRSMNSYKAISLVIIIFLVTAIVVMVQLFSGSRTLTASAADSVDSSGRSLILPYGRNLDFSLINKFNPEGKLFDYPKVNPAEIGLPVSGLVK